MLTFKNLVRQIAQIEGKRVPVNVAQISEILRITLILLATEFLKHPYAVVNLFCRYLDRGFAVGRPTKRG